jgi:hypothetical protein
MKLQLLSISILILLLYGCTKGSSVTPPPPPPDKGWQNLSSMPTPRHDFGFVECNNLLYAVGGYNADGLKTVEAYDPASDKWTTKASMPTARAYLVVASVSNKIYAIGGITGGDLNNITYLKETEEYDPATDTWTEKAPIPITATPFNSVLGNFFMAGATINGKIYVAVGYTEGDLPTYIYDPATDTWSTGKSISKFNNQPYYSTASNSALYILNGNDFLQYLPSSDEWRELPLPQTSMIGSIYGTFLASDNTNVYAMGGIANLVDVPVNSDDAETYDPVHSSWSEDSSLNTARNAAAAAVYNNKLYVVGGATIQNNYTNVPIANLEALSLK